MQNKVLEWKKMRLQIDIYSDNAETTGASQAEYTQSAFYVNLYRAVIGPSG